MTTASIAEVKARLSEFLAAVRRGDDVVITDRGRHVARLTGLGDGAGDARLAELVRGGWSRVYNACCGTPERRRQVILRRLLNVLRARSVEADLRREMEFHVAERVDELAPCGRTSPA